MKPQDKPNQILIPAPGVSIASGIQVTTPWSGCGYKAITGYSKVLLISTLSL